MAEDLTRRQLLVGTGAGAAALLLDPRSLKAQPRAGPAIVFTHTTVVNVDEVRNDVALAVAGNTIAAIGSTDKVLKKYPGGRRLRRTRQGHRRRAGELPLPHVGRHRPRLQRGLRLPQLRPPQDSASSLLRDDENTLMVQVAALEAIRTGTTTIVENVGNIAKEAQALADSGLRCVFAESIRDSENVAGPMSTEGLAESEPPRFSAKLRDEGMQRIRDVFTAWHGKNNGRISVFPAAALAETYSPELLQAVRAFAEKHDLHYTIHLSQSVPRSTSCAYHGVRPSIFLERHGFLGPRLFAAHCRYVDDGDIAALGKSRTVISHQANMAANRAVIPPIAKLRAAGSPSRTARTTTRTTCSS